MRNREQASQPAELAPDKKRSNAILRYLEERIIGKNDFVPKDEKEKKEK